MGKEKKITEYHVLEGYGYSTEKAKKDIGKKIYEYLEDGYKLQGGISFVLDESGWYRAFQAMIKEE